MSTTIGEARAQTARALELVHALELGAPTNSEGYACLTLARGQLEHAARWLRSRHVVFSPDADHEAAAGMNTAPKSSRSERAAAPHDATYDENHRRAGGTLVGGPRPRSPRGATSPTDVTSRERPAFDEDGWPRA